MTADPDPPDDRRGAILFHHAVGEPYGDSYGRTTPRHRLRQDVETFLAVDYRVVDVPTVARTGGAGRIALTFDDGYEPFYKRYRRIPRGSTPRHFTLRSCRCSRRSRFRRPSTSTPTPSAPTGA